MQISNFFDKYYSETYKKNATDFADTIWHILSYAKNYSFAENPLPIFYLLHARFCDLDIDLDMADNLQLCKSKLSKSENNLYIDLLNEFPNKCFESTKEDWEIFEEICFLLNFGYVSTWCANYRFDYYFRDINYKLIHPFVVEYFVQKYIQLQNTNYEFSETFINRISDKIENDNDYYILYSGLSSIALSIFNNLYNWEANGFYCFEDNPTFSLISKIRLCAFGHNFNVKSTSSYFKNNNNSDFSFTKAIISVPPFGHKIKKENLNGKVVYIDVTEDLISKYIDDDSFEIAHFVFPINFARDPKLKNIRQKLIEGKLIKSIDLIPEGSFMSSSSAGILISLDKKNDSDRIKFVFDEGKYSDVSYEEIVNNDFILNPKLYFSNAKTDESKFSYHLNRFMWEPTPLEIEDDKPEISNITSDLIHCLGPIFNRINSAIDVNSDNEDFKLIKDNISYMARVIKAFGADFSSYRTTKNEIGVNEFINEYYSSLQNCNRSIFKIEYNSELSDDTTFDIDEDVMRIMLDTILDNAYRHGFKKAKNIDARVGISTSCKKVNGNDYVLIEVANNGLPFPNDLTYEKFITRGEFCGENGHTGLGGNHIYNIIKLHDGYLNITKSAKWNIIFDILIPIEYISDEDMNNITDYENENWCV